MADISFTPGQVEDAIRHGMRGDRQRYELERSDAEQKNVTDGANMAHYRNVAHECLSERDYLQAAEKSWGSYAQAIKGISAAYGIRVSTHANILNVAQALTALAATADDDSATTLRRGFNMARSLHQHFYENDLEDDEVARQSAEVMDAINLLQSLFVGNGAERID